MVGNQLTRLFIARCNLWMIESRLRARARKESPLPIRGEAFFALNSPFVFFVCFRGCNLYYSR